MKGVKESITDFLYSENVVFLVFYMIMLFLMFSAHLVPGSDDMAYAEALSHTPLLQWVWTRATTWQPRIVSDFLLAVFNFNLPVWKFVTAGVTTILLVCICKITNNKIIDKKILMKNYAIICCSFFCIFPPVLTSSIFWYTGSFFYLWPALFMIIALMPYYFSAIGEEKSNRIMVILVYVCSGLAAYMEQEAAIILCFGLISFFLIKKEREKVPIYLLGAYTVTILNILLYIRIGGTAIRKTAELHWFPDYHMLTLVDKIFLGVNWGNYQFFNSSNILFLILTGLIFLNFYMNNASKIIRTMSAIPFIFSILSVTPFDSFFRRISYNMLFYNNMSFYQEEYYLPVGKLFEKLFNCMHATPMNLNLNLSDIIPSCFCLLIVLYTGFLLKNLFEDKRKGTASFFIYLAALASSYVMCFSPTIFASGNRIFFVTDILLVFLIGLLLNELAKYSRLYASKWFKCILTLLLFISVCYVLEHFLFNISGQIRY